jgi:hypothetical protein
MARNASVRGHRRLLQLADCSLGRELDRVFVSENADNLF